MLGVNAVTYAGARRLDGGHPRGRRLALVDTVLFLCFLIATPWTVLGFWNAAIGLWLLHGRRDGLGRSRRSPPRATARSRSGCARRS